MKKHVIFILSVLLLPICVAYSDDSDCGACQIPNDPKERAYGGPPCVPAGDGTPCGPCSQCSGGDCKSICGPCTECVYTNGEYVCVSICPPCYGCDDDGNCTVFTPVCDHNPNIPGPDSCYKCVVGNTNGIPDACYECDHYTAVPGLDSCKPCDLNGDGIGDVCFVTDTNGDGVKDCIANPKVLTNIQQCIRRGAVTGRIVSASAPVCLGDPPQKVRLCAEAEGRMTSPHVIETTTVYEKCCPNAVTTNYAIDPVRYRWQITGPANASGEGPIACIETDKPGLYTVHITIWTSNKVCGRVETTVSTNLGIVSLVLSLSDNNPLKASTIHANLEIVGIKPPGASVHWSSDSYGAWPGHRLDLSDCTISMPGMTDAGGPVLVATTDLISESIDGKSATITATLNPLGCSVSNRITIRCMDCESQLRAWDREAREADELYKSATIYHNRQMKPLQDAINIELGYLKGLLLTRISSTCGLPPASTGQVATECISQIVYDIIMRIWGVDRKKWDNAVRQSVERLKGLFEKHTRNAAVFDDMINRADEKRDRANNALREATYQCLRSARWEQLCDSLFSTLQELQLGNVEYWACEPLSLILPSVERPRVVTLLCTAPGCSVAISIDPLEVQ